ncbi:DEAD/DEAH box helicase [Oceanivirga salmonicida]|uniref:DEAD/DEAH box helicase n=1 Tax=Oceanivirga salmonicida TaxID=1769291 RepID=UPI0012E136D8|nr:DEAD/DEAH box helicase [Oceanivirga salmonicida]
MLNVVFKTKGFYIEYDKNENIENFLREYEKDKYQAIYELAFKTENKNLGIGIAYLQNIAISFISEVLKDPSLEFTRGNFSLKINDNLKKELILNIPYSIGAEYINEIWIDNFWNELLRVFNMQVLEYKGSIKEYIENKNSNLHIADKIFFHLVENKDEKYPFAFMATYSSKNNEKKTYHKPIEHALIKYKNETSKLVELLSTVLKVSGKSKFIKSLLESGEFFKPIKLNSEEALIFLNEIPLYQENNIVCRIPNWWRKKHKFFQVSFKVDEKSFLGVNSILSFNPTAMLNENSLSKKELKEFLKMAEGLVKFKGEWVNINHEHIKDLINILENEETSKDYTVKDIISMQFGENSKFDESTSIKTQNFLNHLKYILDKRQNTKDFKIPTSIKAKFRNYQKDGYKWLMNMYSLGFGACLADDMGLGKTLQVLALLENIKKKSKETALLVVPASLISNWENEIAKFAPKLKYKILHNLYGDFDKENIIEKNIFLYITTYNMVKKLENLKDIKWHLIVLDESQAIKNPNTKQTKAIKALKSDIRFAMTGTPIENNLGDLWSLFDFINPGLLGTQKSFKDFSKRIIEDKNNIIKLRRTVNPFILRRLKTDKKIISDLPEKIEIKDYVNLTDKQIVLYEKIVNDLSHNINIVEGMKKRGLIMNSIVKLKQICNHPSHYLGISKYNAKDSGKFEYLNNILKTIYDKREKVLIFTQYTEIIPYLDEYLTKLFDKKGLVIHGKIPVKKRGKIVDEFNNSDYIPYMILSLKSAGVGLNLTSANHVIHFDRWWNPAVENQATDRAYRIGQDKEVIVRKFITKGTIEEKIDKMIDEKKQISEDVLSSADDKWISEMSDKEIMDLVKLDI